MVHKLLPQARILPDNLAHPDTGCRTEGFAMVSFGWPGPERRHPGSVHSRLTRKVNHVPFGQIHFCRTGRGVHTMNPVARVIAGPWFTKSMPSRKTVKLPAPGLTVMIV